MQLKMDSQEPIISVGITVFKRCQESINLNFTVDVEAGRQVKESQKLKYHRTTQRLQTTDLILLSLSMGDISLSSSSLYNVHIYWAKL